MTFVARFCLAVVLLGAPCLLRAAGELQTIFQAELIPTEWADGDSFLVRFPDPVTRAVREEVFRLYAVDCMETLSAQETDRRRLLEQARHFGVEKPATLIAEGRAATAYVREELAKPFTIHTAFALAQGRSGKPRYYAFVTTSQGRDLASELVTRGFARVKGISRETADGVPREEYEAHLKDLELAAAMEKVGIWRLSDPTRLAQFRADKREEDRNLAAIQETPKKSGPLDLNTASVREIEALPGIGKILAERIVQGRPYQSPEDLRKIKGVSKSLFEKLKPYLQTSQPGDAEKAATGKKLISVAG